MEKMVVKRRVPKMVVRRETLYKATGGDVDNGDFSANVGAGTCSNAASCTCSMPWPACTSH